MYDVPYFQPLCTLFLLLVTFPIYLLAHLKPIFLFLTVFLCVLKDSVSIEKKPCHLNSPSRKKSIHGYLHFMHMLNFRVCQCVKSSWFKELTFLSDMSFIPIILKIHELLHFMHNSICFDTP